jgi:uncharacterized protein involved in oxidation of intracellular sulfur
MRILIIINDAPYGIEKAYNALRLAMNMQKEKPEIELTVFLMADAVGCAIPNQKTAQGYYNIERMLKAVLNKKGKLKCCGTCLDARGLDSIQLIEGAERSTMQELTRLSFEADKVITF